MISYYDLSLPLRSLFLLGLFADLCMGIYLVPYVCRKKKPLLRVLVFIGILISAVLTVIYAAEAYATLRERTLPTVSKWMCEQSLWIPAVLLLTLGGFGIYLLTDQRKFLRNTVTRFSIKEGVDQLSTGLCFHLEGGRVILVNHRMNELCYSIVGRDLQNGALFWKILCDEDVQSGVQRLSSGDHPSFRLADGTVWTFSRETLQGFYQICAADTTRLQAVMDELKEKNAQLAALNLRLKHHAENVEELTRTKERLETKARIHSGLGQALLSAHRYLNENGSDLSAPMELWKNNIAMLRKEVQWKEEEQPMEMLARVASSTGIATRILGALSEDEKVQKLFVQAAAEALTNAIRHAGAKNLFIRFGADEYVYTASYSNDGLRPDGGITEGGGLSSLRKKIEREGGTMTVLGNPDFVLTITLPRERGPY